MHPRTRTPRASVRGVGVCRRSYRQAGRLVPRSADGLRAGSVILPPGGVMEWHSTLRREELVIALDGRVRLEIHRANRRRALELKAGECAFLPQATQHRVVNHASRVARYLYVTAAASRADAARMTRRSHAC